MFYKKKTYIGSWCSIEPLLHCKLSQGGVLEAHHLRKCCSFFLVLSVIWFCLQIHMKVAEAFITEVSEIFSPCWMSPSLATPPSKSPFLDWFYMRPSVWINQIPVSGHTWFLSTNTECVTLLQWADFEQKLLYAFSYSLTCFLINLVLNFL